MKSVRIVKSPATEINIIQENSIYARNDEVYLIPEEGIEFHRTEGQTQKRIEELEAELFKLSAQLDAIHDIIDPDRYEDVDD